MSQPSQQGGQNARNMLRLTMLRNVVLKSCDRFAGLTLFYPLLCSLSLLFGDVHRSYWSRVLRNVPVQ